jgi:hypothetical protein
MRAGSFHFRCFSDVVKGARNVSSFFFWVRACTDSYQVTLSLLAVFLRGVGKAAATADNTKKEVLLWSWLRISAYGLLQMPRNAQHNRGKKKRKGTQHPHTHRNRKH